MNVLKRVTAIVTYVSQITKALSMGLDVTASNWPSYSPFAKGEGEGMGASDKAVGIQELPTVDSSAGEARDR